MRIRARRTQNRSGLSLIEVVISTLLVGVLLVAAMDCVGAVIRGRLGVGDSGKAEQLLRQLMSEIMEQEYEEPDDPPVFGRESSESGSDRTNWDDVDDYHLWSSSPPEDRSGSPLPNLTDWQRDVIIDWVDPTNPSVTVGSDQGVKRITVTVRRNGDIVAIETALRSDQ